MCRPGRGSLRDPFAGGHIGPPLRGGRGIQEATGIGAKTDLASGAGRSPPPTGATEQGGLRRGVVTPPYGCNAGGAQQTGRCRHRPLRIEGEVSATTRASGAQRSVCAAVARKGWKSEQRASPKCPATSDNPSATAKPCQLPLHKGALGTGDADRRVASLFAMTVLILCHSEEAQRADVGIRPFYDGRATGRRT